VLKNSPHTLSMLTADSWNFPYTREQAAFPLEYIAENKFWPTVRRADDAYGDRNLVCSCAPIEEYMEKWSKSNLKNICQSWLPFGRRLFWERVVIPKI
jgi:hypothetical protein